MVSYDFKTKSEMTDALYYLEKYKFISVYHTGSINSAVHNIKLPNYYYLPDDNNQLTEKFITKMIDTMRNVMKSKCF